MKKQIAQKAGLKAEMKIVKIQIDHYKYLLQPEIVEGCEKWFDECKKISCFSWYNANVNSIETI